MVTLSRNINYIIEEEIFNNTELENDSWKELQIYEKKLRIYCISGMIIELKTDGAVVLVH